MTYANSKYKDDYIGARESVQQFGVSNVKMFRVPETEDDQPPDLAADTQDPIEQPFAFHALVLPVSKAEPGQQENLQEAVGKTRVLLCLENENSVKPDPDYEFIKAKDIFTIVDQKYQVESVQTINPDNQFPVLFDIIVGG